MAKIIVAAAVIYIVIKAFLFIMVLRKGKKIACGKCGCGGEEKPSVISSVSGEENN